MQCELLTVEKVSLASGLEDKDSQIGRLQQDQISLQAQVALCQHQVAQLQAELLQVCICLSHLPPVVQAAAENLCGICAASTCRLTKFQCTQQGLESPLELDVLLLTVKYNIAASWPASGQMCIHQCVHATCCVTPGEDIKLALKC